MFCQIVLVPLKKIAPESYSRLHKYLVGLEKKAAKRKAKNRSLKAEVIALRQRMADLETKMDSGFEKVEAKFEKVDVKFEKVESNIKEKIQAKINSVNERYDERLGTMGAVCHRVLNHVIERSSTEDLQNDDDLIQCLIDSMALGSYVDEVSLIRNAFVGPCIAKHSSLVQSSRQASASRSIFQTMQNRVSGFLGYRDFKHLREANAHHHLVINNKNNFTPLVEQLLKDADTGEINGLFDEEIFDPNNAAGYHMRECLSSKKFLQAIFDHGENSRVKIISSYIHNPPVKHLQKFLDVLDKLGFNEKEAQMLRFLLQTLILSGHRGKFGLAPEPLIAGNLAKGPDDVGTTGLRPPSDFGVMSCPLELAPKQSKEKTREIPNPPHLAAHSSTVHATNALPPHTYAAQQANTQFVYGKPPLRLLKLANDTPLRATTVSGRSVIWANLARPFVLPDVFATIFSA